MYYTYLLFFITAYLFASIEEWLAHKYMMHIPSIFNKVYENHKLHHIQTNPDYTIKDNDIEYICFDIMTVDGFIQFIVCILINTGFFYMLFYNHISIYIIFGTVTALLITNVLIWNTVHSYTHGLDAYEICSPKGLPRKYIDEQNWYVNWSVNNHKAHHYNSTGNFNVVFPGADFLFGTYNTKIKNK